MAIPFVQAKWYRDANRKKGDIYWVVLHSIEGNEAMDTAEQTAQYFANLPSTRKASAHECVDADSVVLCVKTEDVAYQAGPTGNLRGYGIEQAGKAMQTRAQWLDAYGRKMLPRVAHRVWTKCTELGLPIEYVDAAGLRAGRKGVTTHNEIRLAFGETDHTDPGQGYPIDYVLNLARSHNEPSTPGEGMARFPNAVDAVSWPGKGVVVVGKDGGIGTYGGAPFYGSYPGLKPEQRQGDREFVSIEITRVGVLRRYAYRILADDGSAYIFGPKDK